MTKLEEHELELSRVTSRLDDIQARIKNLRSEEADLVAGKQAWEAIVAMERKQLVGSGSEQVASVAEPPVVPDKKEDTDEDMRDYDYGEEDGENKTQFVRDLMQRNAAFGVTANDLKAAAAAAGMKHPPSWPYGPIQRLKKKGEIVKRRGRFYPANKVNSARPNLSLAG